MQRLVHRFPKALAIALTILAGSLGWFAPASAQPGQAKPCAERCFVLTAVTIDGVTAYPIASLAPLYEGALASEVGLADMVEIAQKITHKYKADGYFLSRATMTSLPDSMGRVRIRVYEGYVSETTYPSGRPAAVGRLVDGVARPGPLRLSELERRLSLAMDIPGLQVRAHLEPDLDDPARHRLVVDSRLQRFTGSLYVDNRGSKSAGPVQAYGYGAVNSTLRSGDQLTVGILTTPQDSQEYTQAELGYSLPLWGGARLRGGVFASRSHDQVLTSIFGSEARGASLRLSIPWMRERKRSLWAVAGLDARHIEQSWTGGGTIDDLRILRLGFHGDLTWPGGYSTGQIQFSKGYDLGRAARRSRLGAPDSFWKVSGQASHYRDLGRMAGVYAAVEGQWAATPLANSEAFAVGALPYGRAYGYGEILGDRGVAGLAELRIGANPRRPPFTFLQGYAFVDGGKTWNDQALPARKSAALASAGVGMRVQIAQRTNVRLEAARPIGPSPYPGRDRGWRPFLSISASF